MSVTFFIPDGPKDLEVNMSNGRARAILGLIGLPTHELWGHIKGPELGVVFNTIMKALNIGARRGAIVREPSVDAIPGYCTMIDCGMSDDYIQRRLRQLLELVVAAQRGGLQITYC